MRSMPRKELAKLLEANGWDLLRIQGSHHIEEATGDNTIDELGDRSQIILITSRRGRTNDRIDGRSNLAINFVCRNFDSIKGIWDGDVSSLNNCWESVVAVLSLQTPLTRYNIRISSTIGHLLLWQHQEVTKTP